MGNSNSSSSAVSTPKTPNKSPANGSANNSMRRRSTTRSARLSGKPPPPKLAIKTSLSNQPSLNVDTSALTNGNSSPTSNLSDDANFNNIRSSKSMYELHNKQSPTSPNALPLISQHNGSLRRSPTSTNTPLIINGMCEGVENDATYHLMSSRFAQPSTIAPSAISRTRSIRRSDPSHPLLPAAREICRSCFENPHNDFGNRVLSRVYEKRPDFQKFVIAMGKDKWPLLAGNFQNFVEEIINNIESVDSIQRLSKQYGEEHVTFKIFGFKPDYWVTCADAILVECAILDMANHQPTEVVSAWSSLVTLMFSSIRDGYYSGLRLQRMSTRKKSLRRQESISTVDSSDNSYHKTSFSFTNTSDLIESNGNSMNSSFTDSMHRLSPNGTTRFSFQKSDSQNSCNGKVERPIFE